ncbi:hypothetical protein MIMGU_mgv1a0159352mg, partial [Erythranthe guttata]
ALNSEF